ncbi:hypothetical protein V6Z12_D10G267100, partial [Gossypium hirsutum]
VVVPRLERLDLSSINIHKIWHHSSSPSIGYLNFLRVKRCHNLKYLFPFFLAKDLEQLRFLGILDCNMMEQVIFTDGLVEEHQGRNQIVSKTLSILTSNSFLRHPLLFRIPSFELTLKTFEPSLLSFKNLTTLKVSRCHGFINLIACSTAKCLRLLESLSIDDCEMIEEILACEAEEIQGGIVFPKLKYLQLSCLPCLASFSSAHHSLEFPVLLMVKVTKCPKMRNFCQGDLSTPRLEQMHLTRDEEGELQWEGDLNTTIKHMFDEMNVQNSEVTEVTDQLPKLE